MNHSNWKETVIAMFLVAGTCIGGGILGLPVLTGHAGFIPSIAMMGLAWVMMTATALLYLEVSLTLPSGAHLMTMTEQTLGSWAKQITLVIFGFMTYASLVGYAAPGGEQTVAFAGKFGLPRICIDQGQFLFVALLSSLIVLWAWGAERINSIFFTAMWFMANKKIENWTLWIIADVITIPLYAYRELGMLSIQYLIFTILAVYGYLSWKEKINTSQEIA